MSFYNVAKRVKCEHVESKVEIVGMYEAAGQKAVPLFIVGNGRRVENKIIENLIIHKGCNGNQYCYNNNDQGNCHLHGQK